MTSGDTFTKGTTIGSVNVEGLSQEEAIRKVLTEVEAWMNTSSVIFVFGENSDSASKSETLSFAVEQTVVSAVNGTNNPIQVTWNKKNTIEIIENVSNKRFSEFQEELLEKDLIGAASQLEADNLELNLINYLKIGESIVVSEATIETIDSQMGVNEWKKAVRELRLPPNQPFSLLQFVEDNGIEATDETLSIVATSIYEAILSTNFEIIERHISEHLPAYAKLGFEAVVKRGEKDLIIYNNNPFEYLFRFDITGDGFKVEMVGPKLPYEYKVERTEEEEIKPRTIKQFDSKLELGRSVVKVEGEHGSLITVNRITSQDGKQVETVQISKDYYSPIHKVIKVSVQQDQTQTPTDGTTNPEETKETEEDIADDGTEDTVEDDNENDDDDDDDGDLWDNPPEVK